MALQRKCYGYDGDDTWSRWEHNKFEQDGEEKEEKSEKRPPNEWK